MKRAHVPLAVVSVDTSDPHTWVWHLSRPGSLPASFWLEASSREPLDSLERAFYRLAPLDFQRRILPRALRQAARRVLRAGP